MQVLGRRRIYFFNSVNEPDTNEDEGLSDLLDDFVRKFNSEHLRSRILEGFQQLRESDFSGNSLESTEISVVPDKPLEPHLSCKKNQKEHVKTERSVENEITQSKLQQTLAVLDKDSSIMKFFELNKCSVCLSKYIEILDNSFHIVIPSCGHPLCCACADNILKSTKKECPRCRGNITADSFNVMKFNDDLQIEAQDQTVFL